MKAPKTLADTLFEAQHHVAASGSPCLVEAIEAVQDAAPGWLFAIHRAAGNLEVESVDDALTILEKAAVFAEAGL